MRVLCLGALFLLAAFAAFAACSTPSDEARTGTIAQRIQGGATDAADTYAVGVCRNVGRTPGHCEDFCSGALILPNVVATARHCVSEAPESVDCSTSPVFGAMRTGPLYITTNGTMGPTTGDAGWYRVANVRVPDDGHICGGDMALLELEAQVPADVAKPITPGVQYSIWDPAQYEPIFAAIGYGNQSTAQNDGLGTRRKLDYVSVLCVPGSNTYCAPPFSDLEFVGGDGTCSGDSGSSAFERTTYDKGAPVSLGVLSRGGAKGATCTGSIYTRFDTKRDFVLSVGAEASAGWTLYPEPTWTVPKPAAFPHSSDAGAVDASIPDASLCGSGTCTPADAGSAATSGASSDAGGCSVRHARSARGFGPAALVGAIAIGVRLRMRRRHRAT